RATVKPRVTLMQTIQQCRHHHRVGVKECVNRLALRAYGIRLQLSQPFAHRLALVSDLRTWPNEPQDRDGEQKPQHQEQCFAASNHAERYQPTLNFKRITCPACYTCYTCQMPKPAGSRTLLRRGTGALRGCLL